MRDRAGPARRGRAGAGPGRQPGPARPPTTWSTSWSTGWTQEPVFATPTPVVLASVSRYPRAWARACRPSSRTTWPPSLLDNPADQPGAGALPQPAPPSSCTPVPEGTVVTRGVDDPAVLAEPWRLPAMASTPSSSTSRPRAAWLVLRARLTKPRPRTCPSSGPAPWPARPAPRPCCEQSSGPQVRRRSPGGVPRRPARAGAPSLVPAALRRCATYARHRATSSPAPPRPSSGCRAAWSCPATTARAWTWAASLVRLQLHPRRLPGGHGPGAHPPPHHRPDPQPDPARTSTASSAASVHQRLGPGDQRRSRQRPPQHRRAAGQQPTSRGPPPAPSVASTPGLDLRIGRAASACGRLPRDPPLAAAAPTTSADYVDVAGIGFQSLGIGGVAVLLKPRDAGPPAAGARPGGLDGPPRDSDRPPRGDPPAPHTRTACSTPKPSDAGHPGQRRAPGTEDSCRLVQPPAPSRCSSGPSATGACGCARRAWRPGAWTVEGRMAYQTGPVSLDEVIRLDEADNRGDGPARPLGHLDRRAAGRGAIRIVDLAHRPGALRPEHRPQPDRGCANTQRVLHPERGAGAPGPGRQPHPGVRRLRPVPWAALVLGLDRAVGSKEQRNLSGHHHLAFDPIGGHRSVPTTAASGAPATSSSEPRLVLSACPPPGSCAPSATDLGSTSSIPSLTGRRRGARALRPLQLRGAVMTASTNGQIGIGCLPDEHQPPAVSAMTRAHHEIPPRSRCRWSPACASRNYTQLLDRACSGRPTPPFEEEDGHPAAPLGLRLPPPSMKVRWNDGNDHHGGGDPHPRQRPAHRDRAHGIPPRPDIRHVIPATSLGAAPSHASPTPPSTRPTASEGLRVNPDAAEMSMSPGHAGSCRTPSRKATISSRSSGASWCSRGIPPIPETLRAKGSILLLLGERDKAIEIYEEVEEIESDPTVRAETRRAATVRIGTP